MRRTRSGTWACRLLAMALAWSWLPVSARAADDPRAYDAAVFLLSQTTQPYRDGRHNGLLLGLRHLDDPALSPLFEALSASPHAPQRLHGRLGLAEVSPTGHMDLAVAAEVEDPAELTELLGAAIDGGLLDTADLIQVLRWEALELSARLALAVRVVAGGGAVDEALLRRMVLQEEDAADASKLLSHGLASLLLIEGGDRSAAAGLGLVDRYPREPERDAVRAQLLEVAYRHGFTTLGPWAMSLAEDESLGLPLRLAGLRVALSFAGRGAGGDAAALWQALFRETDDPAGRVRLALLALEAAHRVDPALFGPLVAEDDATLRLIGEAGRAVAGGALETRGPVLALVGHGHPLCVHWAVWYAREEALPADRGPILAAVVRGAVEGSPRTRARRTQYAIDAAQALAELDPGQAAAELGPLLVPDPGPAVRGELAPRHIVLLGWVRARQTDLTALAASLPEQADADARDLVLLLRARWADDLSADEWSRVSRVVAGASSLDATLRIQLAWLYLKHIGRADEAVREATATRP